MTFVHVLSLFSVLAAFAPPPAGAGTEVPEPAPVATARETVAEVPQAQDRVAARGWLPHYLAAAGDEQAVSEPEAVIPDPFELLGEAVQPGELARLSWHDRQSFPGLEVPAPVLVAHGANPGPVLCLTAAIHGDELNGIEIVRNLMFGLDPDSLNGTVVGVPIVNLHGFRRGSRYLPDRRDLNRFFPGNPNGSSASRIAYSFFQSIVSHCNWLVDLHTGSLRRSNLPQLRADLNSAAIVHLTRGFGATVVLHSPGAGGSLRRAASDAGIPAVTLEAGEPMRFQPDEVSHGVKALRSLLNHLGMDARSSFWEEPQPVYYQSRWVRADTAGILTNRVELGQTVEADELLGTIVDPITNARTEIRSPFGGRIIGMALNQAMMPGFAAYHIGEQADGQAEEEWAALELPEMSEAGDHVDEGPEVPPGGEQPHNHEDPYNDDDPEHGGMLEDHDLPQMPEAGDHLDEGLEIPPEGEQPHNHEDPYSDDPEHGGMLEDHESDGCEEPAGDGDGDTREACES